MVPSCLTSGVRDDLHMGMTALSASISAVNQETKDGTKAVLVRTKHTLDDLFPALIPGIES